MKIVAALTAKDEDWIIKKTLSVLNKFCDKIIILDDNSTDNTEKICRSFEKVDWHVRKKRTNIWERKEAEGLNECFTLAAKHNPDYILMLDADEIPTPSFINFINNIDTSVSAWCIRMINLQPDINHYRTDNFFTSGGIRINNDPFGGRGWRKTVLIKYDENFNYTYNFNIQKGGTSQYHPAPQNLKNVKLTEDFYVIHYGRLGQKYKSGEKNRFYSLIESRDGKGTYENRLKHHEECRTKTGINGMGVKKCLSEWFWDE